MSAEQIVSYCYEEIRNTYRDFIGGASLPGKLKTSILWFAFKRIFFMGDTNKETYDLLKVLNRVFEHEQHVNVFNHCFGIRLPGRWKNKKDTTKEDIHHFQAYLLSIFEDLAKQYLYWLTQAKEAKRAKTPRRARFYRYQATQLEKILRNFKKYHNRWARRYQLKERIGKKAMVFSNEGYHEASKEELTDERIKKKESYTIELLAINYRGHKEQRIQEQIRRERRHSKQRFKPFALAITGLVASGCAFLVFNGLLYSLGFGILPALLIATGVFIVNVRIFYSDTANLFKFRHVKDIVQAFILGIDFVNGHITREHPALTALIVLSSLSMGLGFGLATAMGVFLSLASFAFFPIIPAWMLAGFLGFVTFISFNGVLNAGLRKHFNQFQQFSFRKHWQNLHHEWKEISNVDNAYERRSLQIHFIVDKIVKAMIWPVLIVISAIAVIAILGALCQDITLLFAAIPTVSSAIATGVASGIVAFAALPAAVFNFTAIREMFNILLAVVADVIATTIFAIINPLKSAAQLEKYIREKSQQTRTFIERFRCDPWKTIGQMWENIKTGGLFIACGVNAFGNGAFVAGGASTLQNTFRMPITAANLTAQGTGITASLGVGISFSKVVVDEQLEAKLTATDIKGFRQDEEIVANQEVGEQDSFLMKQPKSTLSFFGKDDYDAGIKKSNRYMEKTFLNNSLVASNARRIRSQQHN